MSTFASLKQIDPVKYVTVRMLDLIGVDVDGQDGHLYFPQDPTVSIDLADKIVRVDMGKQMKGVNYTVFMPLSREDHAQFLMTLLLHAQILDDYIDGAEALEANFILRSDLNLTDDDGFGLEIPTTTVVITDSKEEEHGEATHVDPAIATCMAVMNYAAESKWIDKMIRDEIIKELEDIYVEMQRIRDLPKLEKRRMRREQIEMLADRDYEESDVMNDLSELGFVEKETPEEELERYCEDHGEMDCEFDENDFFEEFDSKDTEFSEVDFMKYEVAEGFATWDMFAMADPSRDNDLTIEAPVQTIDEVRENVREVMAEVEDEASELDSILRVSHKPFSPILLPSETHANNTVQTMPNTGNMNPEMYGMNAMENNFNPAHIPGVTKPKRPVVNLNPYWMGPQPYQINNQFDGYLSGNPYTQNQQYIQMPQMGSPYTGYGY